jgi:hypothetical protein
MQGKKIVWTNTICSVIKETKYMTLFDRRNNSPHIRHNTCVSRIFYYERVKLEHLVTYFILYYYSKLTIK